MFTTVFKVIALLAAASAAPEFLNKVYGGDKVAEVEADPFTGFDTANNTGEYPYIVSVEKKGRHYCGGALIRDDVVLTAAHCTEGLPAFRLQVRAGIIMRGQSTDQVQVRKVKYYVNHPDYSKNVTATYDISLIKLEKKFKLNDIIGLATMPDETDKFTGETVMLLGWGEDESGKLSPVLKKAHSEIISNKKCQKILYKTIPDVMICAFDRTHRLRGVCSGDSGGPVVHGNNTVIGINSWVIKGKQYCNPKYPSVANNIAVLKPWITEQLAERFTDK